MCCRLTGKLDKTIHRLSSRLLHNDMNGKALSMILERRHRLGISAKKLLDLCRSDGEGNLQLS